MLAKAKTHARNLSLTQQVDMEYKKVESPKVKIVKAELDNVYRQSMQEEQVKDDLDDVYQTALIAKQQNSSQYSKPNVDLEKNLQTIKESDSLKAKVPIGLQQDSN